MPIRTLKTHLVLVLSAAAFAASLAAFYIFGLYWTKLVLDILLLGASFIVSVTWFSAAMQAIKDAARTAADKIVLTVWISWTALLIQRVYVLTGTALSDDQGVKPDWWANSPGSVIVASLILIAGAYASYATIGEVDVPLRERRFVLIATFIGGLLVGGTLVAAIAFNLHF